MSSKIVGEGRNAACFVALQTGRGFTAGIIPTAAGICIFQVSDSYKSSNDSSAEKSQPARDLFFSASASFMVGWRWNPDWREGVGVGPGTRRICLI